MAGVCLIWTVCFGISGLNVRIYLGRLLLAALFVLGYVHGSVQVAGLVHSIFSHLKNLKSSLPFFQDSGRGFLQLKMTPVDRASGH